jgi:glycine oxidase
VHAVVVGGGAIGLSVAWRAAERGVRVTVVDPAPASGASRVAAGMLAPVTEVHFGEEGLLALALESSRRYPDFVGELEVATGQSTGYRPCGTLAVARDGDDLAELHQVAAYQERLGLTVERVRARDCRALEPALAPGIRGGVLVEGDHQVDPRRLLAALLAACRRAGVVLVQSRALRWEPGRLHLDNGPALAPDVVVLASGAWSTRLEGLPTALAALVRPVKGQLARLHGDPFLSHNVRGLDAYLVPRADGEVVVGATVEERGFDPTVTAGAVHDLLRAAVELVPDVRELALVSTEAGFRPGTPDNAPLLGSAEDGLVLATGHYRNGILLAPVTADAIADLLVTGALPAIAAPFAPARFARSTA